MNRLIQKMMTQNALNRWSLLFIAGVIGSLSAISPASAQADYPTRPIKIVVPYTAGGNVDITARVISKKLSEQLGQQVIVENRPGASTIIGSQSVAKAHLMATPCWLPAPSRRPTP